MPRPRKSQKKPVTRRSWYHAIPGYLWKMGYAAVSAYVAKAYGPLAAAAFASMVEATRFDFTPNPDYWHRKEEYAYEYPQGRLPQAYHDIYGPESDWYGIPDIDDINDGWQFPMHPDDPDNPESPWYRGD